MFKSPPQIPSPCEWRLRLPLPGHPDLSTSCPDVSHIPQGWRGVYMFGCTSWGLCACLGRGGACSRTGWCGPNPAALQGRGCFSLGPFSTQTVAWAKEQFLVAGKVNSSLGSGEECGKVIPAARLPAQAGSAGLADFSDKGTTTTGSRNC